MSGVMQKRCSRRMRPTHCLAIALLCLAAPGHLSAQGATAADAAARRVTVTITVALVMPNLTVRPVPLHALSIFSKSDSERSTSLRTTLDGKATVELSPGAYRIRSVQAVQLADSSYRWDVPLEVGPSTTTLELTNANAEVSAVGLGARIVAHADPERVVFEQARRGVFRVEAGLVTGSGFLIGDHGGLVVTNAHVVHNAASVSLVLDSATRVPAQVVVRDEDADLALLRFETGRCADCPRLQIARPESGQTLAVAGDRVVAIGYPLHQSEVLTTGIVSSVRDGVIVTDVNINHGNSGGPMLNLAGQVIAVTTFIDPGENGPGIGGAVAISRLDALLRKVPAAEAKLPQVDAGLLPVQPQGEYPLALVRSVADTATERATRFLRGRSAGNFNVSLMTPVLYRMLTRMADEDVAKDRRKREARAGIAAENQFSDAAALHDWERYVGTPLAPMITFTISPGVGETFWSALGRGMEARYGGTVSPAKMKFRGDVRGARFYRNGVEVEPYAGGHSPVAMRIEDRWVELKDVADQGWYAVPPALFEPDSDGTPALVTITIQDLKNPKILSSIDYWGEVSAWVWNSFVPYFEAAEPGGSIRRANPALHTPKIPLLCDPETGFCRRKS